MKISPFVFTGVLCVIGSAAFASNNGTFGPNQTVSGNVPQGPQLLISDCATGFTKSDVTGSPTGSSYGYECKTPLIVCPAAPAGMSGGMSNPAATPSGKGEVFKYYCSWIVPPK